MLYMMEIEDLGLRRIWFMFGEKVVVMQFDLQFLGNFKMVVLVNIVILIS